MSRIEINRKYQLNKQCKNKEYYRNATFSTIKCHAYLIFNSVDIILKGQHTCNNSINRFDTRQVSIDDFIRDFLNEETSNLCLSPFQIYDNLLVQLRNEFNIFLYKVPLKHHICD
ncbi:hypothetical protein RF11_01142 [Thelohanellus kitauei]|uniref:FLYWCH-type domain-containing protein n=1 Tax=Thelohanellus kitauei TaxID=669202 RepID=A0A0C2J5A0_THEKT|nr:hypothetical protein RF11_01142 [Thelohanellus kitauei]